MNKQNKTDKKNIKCDSGNKCGYIIYICLKPLVCQAKTSSTWSSCILVLHFCFVVVYWHIISIKICKKCRLTNLLFGILPKRLNYHIIMHWNKSWLPQSHMNIGTWRLTKCLKTDGKKNKRFALCCSCMRILTERARAIQLLSIPLLYNISSSHYSPRVDNMMIIHYTWYGKTRGGWKDE